MKMTPFKISSIEHWNGLDQDQASKNVWPDLDPKCLTFWLYSWKNFSKSILNKNRQTILVGFVALRPKSTAMVIAGRSVHLTTLFPGQAWTSRLPVICAHTFACNWQQPFLNESAEGRRMTVEIISWSISTKVWDRAGIELATPGSAVRHASVARHFTDCATPPGNWQTTKNHAKLPSMLRVKLIEESPQYSLWAATWENPSFVFRTLWDSSLPARLQRLARKLKFCL